MAQQSAQMLFGKVVTQNTASAQAVHLGVHSMQKHRLKDPVLCYKTIACLDRTSCLRQAQAIELARIPVVRRPECRHVNRVRVLVSSGGSWHSGCACSSR